MLIGIIGWVIAGLIVGFAASKIVNLRGDDPRLGIALSVVAAVVAAALYSLITQTPVGRFNVWSIAFAVIGALLAVIAWHFARTRGSYRTPTSRRSY